MFCLLIVSQIAVKFRYWVGIRDVEYIHAQWGKKLFDPLLILYISPLTKKLSVYNFNVRFTWTVRDRITTKIQKNTFQKSYKYILMSQISIWPLCKTWLSTWCQNIFGNHRGQMFLVVGHQVCTHRRRDFIPLLLQILSKSLRFRGLRLATRTFSSLHRFSMGLRSGDWLGHSRTLMCFFLSHSFVTLACVFGSFLFWNIHQWPIFKGPGWLQMPWHWTDSTRPRPSPFDAWQLSCPRSRHPPRTLCFHLHVWWCRWCSWGS